MPSLLNEHQQWIDEDTGQPINAGYVYIGALGLDPTVLANQLSLYSDKFLTVPITNPQRTDTSGRTVNKVYVAYDYSIEVQDSSGVQKYSDLYAGNFASSDGVTVSVDSMADLIAIDTQVTTSASMVSFHPDLNKGGGRFNYDETQSRANHNGGTIIDPTNTADLSTWDATAKTAWFTAGSGSGCWVAIYSGPVNPLMFGGKGDGAEDDSKSLNASLDYFRILVGSHNAIAASTATVVYDGSGGIYKTTSSIDGTAIQSWGWQIKNLLLIGHCTGKCVLDMVASRGGHLSDILIYGDETNEPSTGIQAARSSESVALGFCDNNLWENITTIGYFSTSGAHIYSQETTTYNHCRFWNYDDLGYAAIHEGIDTHIMSSDYRTLKTGAQSFINNKYINMDYRFLPIGQIATVTAITKANPAVVTINSHPFTNGQTITLTQVGGMVEVNNLNFTVANATTNTIELSGINSTSYTAYTSGGSVIKRQSKPTVYWERGSQHYFDDCYMVNYGQHHLEIGITDAEQPKHNKFDVLYEGGGNGSHVRFTGLADGGSRTIRSISFESYNIIPTTSFFSMDGSAGKLLTLYNPKVSITNGDVGKTLTDQPVLYKIYGADIFYPSKSDIEVSTINVFTGKHSSIDSANYDIHGGDFTSDLDGSYSPTITSGAGTITTVGSVVAYVRKIGDMVHLSLDITITTNGTGATSLLVSLPSLAASNGPFILSGRENVNTGNQLQGLIVSGSAQAVVKTYNNSYPAADGAQIILSGWYQSA